MSDEPKNSFKKLEKLQEEQYADNLEEVKRKVDGNINSIGSFINILDVYFSKVIGYFVAMTGGTTKSDDDKEV